MMEESGLLEDGEVENSEPEENAYKTVDRPQSSSFRAQQKPMMESDSDVSDGIVDSSSDEGGRIKPRVKLNAQKPSNPNNRVNPPTRNGNLWRSLLQEECLTENLQTFDVSTSRKRKYERGAESYDFQNHKMDESLSSFIKKQKKFDHLSSNDSSSSTSSNKSKGRKIKAAKYKNKDRKRDPKVLPNIIISFNTSDEEYGQVLAKNLEEEKSDLIIRVVTVIGKDESLKFYNSTKNIERKGGMLTVNKQRRRTPGGIFLWLLKTSNRLDEKQKKEIFESEKEKQMSDGNWSMNPPPPSPVDDLIANNEKPEPNLVSQKILSSIPDRNLPGGSRGDEDILDLDYNSDMDTF